MGYNPGYYPLTKYPERLSIPVSFSGDRITPHLFQPFISAIFWETTLPFIQWLITMVIDGIFLPQGSGGGTPGPLHGWNK